MQEPAPKGTIQRPVIVSQIGHQTEQNISGHLNQMEHKSTPQSVSVDHSSVFEDIKRVGGEVLHDTRDYVGTTLEEIAGGATHIRGTDSKTVLGIAKEKASKIVWK